MTTDTEEFLEHYGVKGMKWGVRRDRSTTSTKPKKSSLRKEAKDLSDEDLKKSVERLRLEREYVKIKDELNPSDPDLSFLKKHGQQATNIAISSITTAAVGLVLSNTLKKNK